MTTLAKKCGLPDQRTSLVRVGARGLAPEYFRSAAIPPRSVTAARPVSDGLGSGRAALPPVVAAEAGVSS